MNSPAMTQAVMETMGHNYCEDPYYGCPLSEDREWRDEEKVCTCNLEGRARAVLETVSARVAVVRPTRDEIALLRAGVVVPAGMTCERLREVGDVLTEAAVALRDPNVLGLADLAFAWSDSLAAGYSKET